MTKQPIQLEGLIEKGQGLAGPQASDSKPLTPKPQILRVASTFRLRVEDHQLLRDAAHQTGRSMQDFLDEAIDEWLRSRGLR